MSRDNFSHQHRSRSRSFSAYRYNSHRNNRMPSPGPPPKFRKRSESPAERYRHSQSPPQRNGGRNGHKSPERRRRSESRPEPSAVLGVFGLHVRTSEGEIRDIFERFGNLEKIHMVYDAKSRGFRGYCFIYFTKVRDATAALNQTNGMELKERRIRVDYSKTKRAHTPTPGFYRGNRGQRNRSFERQRPPPRRDFNESRVQDRFRREEHPRYRSRERRDERPSFREVNRDREMRNRSDVRRRSMDRGMGGRRSPPRRDFRRRDRS